MGIFYYIALGKPCDYNLPGLEEFTARLLPGQCTFCVNRLPTQEILFILASEKPLDLESAKKVRKLIRSTVDVIFERSDLYENEVPASRYLLCINTGLALSGRNPKIDSLVDSIWNILCQVDVDFVQSFGEGYLFLNFSSINPLPHDIKHLIKVVAETAYPNSFVFEHPVIQ